MATTIKLKSGSGAPLAGDLVAAEPAFDLTNKRLYTEDSGGTVIEVGTNPSTIDINAGTIDGTVIGGSSAAAGTFTTFTSTGIDDNATSTAITIDASENVGIGTASPASKLEVSGTSTGAWITLDRQDSGSNIVDFTQSGTRLGYIGYIVNDLILNNATASNTIFNTNNTERMRIDSSGNVGIGTTSPSTPLAVTATTTGSILTLDKTTTATNSVEGGLAILTRTSGTAAAGLGSRINFITENSNGTVYETAFIDAFTSTSASAQKDGVLAFSTANGVNNPTERMRIDSSGKVGIGTTSPSRQLVVYDSTQSNIALQNSGSGTTLTDGFQMQYDGTAYLWNYENSPMLFGTGGFERMRLNSLGALCVGLTNSTIGSGNVIVNEGVYVGAANGNNQIRSSSAGGGSATLYIGNAAIQVSSDRRLKENIVDTSMSALEKLDQVRVVDFTWNDPSDTAVNNRNARGVWTGIIAQELVDVFPFAVNAPRNEDDLSIDEQSESTWQVEQDQLVPVLIKAIQELKAEVAALKGA